VKMPYFHVLAGLGFSFLQFGHLLIQIIFRFIELDLKGLMGLGFWFCFILRSKVKVFLFN
jgi:hypothetical protein